MPEERLKFSDRVACRTLFGLLHLIALLPLSVSQTVGRFIGRCSYRLGTRAARVTATNISLCLPDLSCEEQRQLIRESLEQTGQMLMETPAAWLGSMGRMRRWIREVINEPLVDAAIAAEEGMILVLPHIGNWELINAYFGIRARELGNPDRVGLYAPPRKTYMRGITEVIRGRFGNEMVPTTPRGLARLYRCLEEGGFTVILPDQVPARGEFAPFFGHDCLTDQLIPRLIRKTGARAVCCVIERLPHAGGFRINFSEPDPDIYSTDLATSLRGLNKSVENCVRQAPPQYQWEYKRFKERPAGERRIYEYKNRPRTYH